jgi:ubiquitin-protein ligase E3 C
MDDVINGLDADLEKQITAAIDSRLLQHLVCSPFSGQDLMDSILLLLLSDSCLDH